ncbi:MAG: hypothetical protein QME51_05705 [Planctomycetota bacterium]|nr:hypothetical protein [Planctomycetota bacterium]MDI6787847.1 hypothetical protein [Planctomycetota bacterium]
MFVKRTIPLIIAFILGITLALRYYIPHQIGEDYLTIWSKWARIIGGFAIVLGLYSLFHLHLAKIKRKMPGWGYSIIVFLGFAVTIFLGLIREIEIFIGIILGKSIDLSSPFASYEASPFGSAYDWIYQYIFNACGATMFSILAFFIASAAYRTFRARSREATILLIAAIIIMVARVPIGGLISSFIPELADWIMEVPNMAAKRGILLGICLGSIATSLRVIFGIERSYLGGGE